MEIWMAIGFVVLGLALLIKGGDWLLDASVGLALKLSIPKVVIGMTIVSFATSAPELLVSLNAALSGHAEISLGNVVGSNIANLGLVLAITVLITTISIPKSFYTTDWPVMVLASVLLYVFLLGDGTLVRHEGIIMFSMLLAFLIYLLKFQKTAVEDDQDQESEPMALYKIILFLVLGGVCLWAGSELLVKGAVDLAKNFGVSDRVISITVVSIGTSVPELAASIFAAIKKEKSISLGNLLGSNIFNILAVLGITSMVSDIQVSDTRFMSQDLIWMLAIAFSLPLLSMVPKKHQFDKITGILLLGAYLFFIYLTIN